MADDPLPAVTGDPTLISFVVRELVKNAVESLPGGAGDILIQLKHVRENNGIRLLVKDSGRGIPAEVRGRLFQPFFTTKSHRQGLSLSRAKRYAEFHGGKLELIESSATGSLFQLDLPLSGQAVNAAFAMVTARRPDPSEAA